MYESLNKLKKQLKKIQSLSSNIGGGEHGNLGLILTTEEYALSPLDEEEHTTHPGALNIPDNTPQITALTMRDYHKEYISIFRKNVDMEKSLKKQVVAIDNLYIK